jgi:2-hydroxy-6-oxonona-2,4-dienedioate hydrolase
MENCGHWPQYEDTETFNRIHLDFLLGRPEEETGSDHDHPVAPPL